MAGNFSCQQVEIEQQELAHQIHIERDVYTQYALDSAYGYVDGKESRICQEIGREGCGWIGRNSKCSKRKFRSFVFGHLPIIDWLPKYSLRRDLIYDIIGGLTVGVMHIPQGMAYGTLAGLDQINGLYTSFFASLVYVFFGTSRHVSIGTFAVISMMMGNLRDRLIPETNSTAPAFSNSTPPPDFPISVTPVELSMSVTLLVGIILLCMFVLRLGFLTSYLSDSLISGFTTGAAVHVLYTQIPPILGVKKPNCGDIGKLLCSTQQLIGVIRQTNLVTLAISLVCIVLVYVMKEYISPVLKRITNLPLPGELIAIVLGTMASYFGRLGDNFGVSTVGDMPTGLPVPALPRMDIIEWIIGDSISIAIVIFSVTVSVAKIFAKKHHYRIDSNQELLALGLVQLFCSVFSCFPPSGSLGRSTLFEGTGTRTQIAAIIGCGVVLIVLLWLGPLFYALPNCILAGIIVVALKGMLMQFKEFRILLRVSKIDALIWMSSFVAVICFGVTYGLAASVIVGLLTLILRLQWPSATLLTWLPGTELYRNQEHYKEGQSIYGVKIFRFDAPLNFANAERFQSSLLEACNVDMERSKTYLRTCSAFPPIPPRHESLDDDLGDVNACSTPVCATKEPRDENGNDDGELDPCTSRNNTAITCSPVSLHSLNDDPPTTTEYIIIDCSAFGYVDMMGLDALKRAYQELSDIGIRVLFASCRASLRAMFEASNFHMSVPPECLYVTIHDAIMVATGGNLVGLKLSILTK